MSETVAIVGAGLIGRAWAIAFARAGWSVRLWDADAAVPARTLATIEPLLADMAHHGLLDGQDVPAVMARIAPATDLGEALAGVAWVQENAPERVEVKRELWARMDPLAPREAILASSTSAIVPSRFTEHLEGRERCVVTHPLNPPYLIPAVEVVPAPWTSKASMDRAAGVMRAIGQSPIMMTRELDGFVMNRMQGALLEEAFRLVADGLCTAEEIDIGLREGLALRWSFMGPFETIDLNAPGGVRDYVTRYQGIYETLFPSMQRRVDWAGPVLEKVEKERRGRVAEDALAERQNWRDRRLMALAGHKRRAAKDIGD
ncbi:3-hydroxyacyl-CoA dehydrogenase [Marinimicrococcus flavescens]|uniref:L-gulonate 3-dehydrogenase n=1 Tax=Marinimicrococcus flavescens TaxID=3031815 RepID=A0AAP3UXY7_9PROT|nr:3-hydroxyacyl-CoA dehydrogenase [Marinimicrococcus flavescens]